MSYPQSIPTYSYTVTGQLVTHLPEKQAALPQEPQEPQQQEQRLSKSQVQPLQNPDGSDRLMDDTNLRDALSGNAPATWNPSLLYEDESTFGHSTDSLFPSQQAPV